jgi:Cu(I)/Ag(I) efflux system membrane fusion protein
VRIVLPNREGLLRESMYATVVIDATAASRTSALSVPESALIDSGRVQVVLIAKGQGQFVPRTVRIGARGDGRVQILSGLEIGEQVVAGANFLIDAESNMRAALRTFAADKNKAGDAQ